jgi:hypothetical protein
VAATAAPMTRRRVDFIVLTSMNTGAVCPAFETVASSDHRFFLVFPTALIVTISD